jgi:hypothetical protein
MQWKCFGKVSGSRRAPKGDPGTKPSNGEVERAVRTVRGIARTLTKHAEQYTRCVLDPKCPILAWLIEYAGVLHYLFHRGEDGMAFYQRAKGKEWAIALPAFGGSIDFKKDARRKLESRWERGVYLGVHPDTTERILGASKGVYVVQSVRRVPESERCTWEAMASVRGLSWKPVPDCPDNQDAFELPAPVELHPYSPEAPVVPVEAADQERAVRRYYVAGKDLEKYGRSDGCAACDTSKANIPRGGIAHAPGCRERIEAAVKADPQRSTRYSAAQDKITAFIAKRVAEGAADNERDGKRREGEPGNAAATSSHDPQGSVHASAAAVGQSAGTSTEMRADSGKGLKTGAESEAQPDGGAQGVNQLAKDMVESCSWGRRMRSVVY